MLLQGPFCLSCVQAVLVGGLGTFFTLQEQFCLRSGKVLAVQRPVFHLSTAVDWLLGLKRPAVTLPDNVKLKWLNYRRLSWDTGFPVRVVESCVQETVLLFSSHLLKKEHVTFVFKYIGVLACKGDEAGMKFCPYLIHLLESKAGLLAALHSRPWPMDAESSGGETASAGIQSSPAHVFPRFQLTVEGKAKGKAAPRWCRWEIKALGELRSTRSSGEGHGGKLLQSQQQLALPMLPNSAAGTRQQDPAEESRASLLPPCPGSSPRTKKASKQQPPPAASSTAALAIPESCRRILQETVELRAQWDRRQSLGSLYRERHKEAEAEQAAWKAWSAGEGAEPAQDFGREETWAPHPPAQPRRKERSVRWKRQEKPPPVEEKKAGAKLETVQPHHLSPRAAQILKSLQPYKARRETFKYIAERKRQQQAEQKQCPCTRRSCWYGTAGGSTKNVSGAKDRGPT
ncbi:coiled-coil domain-containing protein 81-like isoform X2 [Apteryx mantelli]|uniref:Coiled-coil domain-containing protein 81-like isoform X2 n=1 Tax=Apteryx mantelli TaxID=2696672 RepID=A0ABM4FU38_9AVES